MNKIFNISHVLLLTAILLLTAACSSDSSNDVQTTNNQQEISLVPTVWQMMEGTRATTYGSVTDLQNEGSFTCQIYKHDTNTLYNPSVTVTWSDPKWIFSDGKHYWPAEGSLDFFAFMPATKPDYITTIDYAADNPQFTCSEVGVSAAKEFAYALTENQSKAGQGATGVALNFKHPFATVTFQWSTADHSAITINSIKLKNIYTEGTFSHTGSPQWITSGTTSELTATGMGGPFLVIPQTFGGEIEVNASWNDWGDSPVAHTVSKTISAITWQPGKTYTYTFTISTDDLTVDINSYTEQW